MQFAEDQVAESGSVDEIFYRNGISRQWLWRGGGNRWIILEKELR